jgi:hypothetical protein
LASTSFLLMTKKSLHSLIKPFVLYLKVSSSVKKFSFLLHQVFLRKSMIEV